MSDEIDSRELLLARCARGESPLAAAAALARLPEVPLRSARMLLGAAAFLDPEDLGALSLCEGTDALAMVALSAWLPLPSRIAAAEGLSRAPITSVGLAALMELTESSQKPPFSQARASLDAIGPRLSESQREQAAKLRHVARHIREKLRGGLRRQELQREVARGSLHPIVGALAGDADFLLALVPPLADEARAALVPHLIALARHPSEVLSQRAMSWFQRRFRELAAPTLSALARSAFKGKDAAVPVEATRALGALGALDEILAVIVAGPRAARSAALAELEKATVKARAELDPGALRSALETLVEGEDAELAARAGALRKNTL